MMMQRTAVSAVCLVLSTVALAHLSGCSSPRSRALFTRPELYTYERHAVFGLQPEHEQIFMAAYIRTFSKRVITFVERSRLREVISEQDLLRGRLDEKTRAKIKRVLGVEALIMCDYYADNDKTREKKFRVRIVDSETGAIVGSVVTEARGDFENHARAAVEAIRRDLLSGDYKPYYVMPESPKSGSTVGN